MVTGRIQNRLHVRIRRMCHEFGRFRLGEHDQHCPGTGRDVRWFVVKNGDDFKVRDAQALGYWLTPFQRRLFVSFIKKHGGDVNALLYALGS